MQANSNKRSLRFRLVLNISQDACIGMNKGLLSYWIRAYVLDSPRNFDFGQICNHSVVVFLPRLWDFTYMFPPPVVTVTTMLSFEVCDRASVSESVSESGSGCWTALMMASWHGNDSALLFLCDANHRWRLDSPDKGKSNAELLHCIYNKIWRNYWMQRSVACAFRRHGAHVTLL